MRPQRRRHRPAPAPGTPTRCSVIGCLTSALREKTARHRFLGCDLKAWKRNRKSLTPTQIWVGLQSLEDHRAVFCSKPVAVDSVDVRWMLQQHAGKHVRRLQILAFLEQFARLRTLWRHSNHLCRQVYRWRSEIFLSGTLTHILFGHVAKSFCWSGVRESPSCIVRLSAGALT